MRTLGMFIFFNLVIKKYWEVLSKKLQSYGKDKVLPYALLNFGDSTINKEGVIPCKTVFCMLYISETQTTHLGVTSS